MDTVENEPKTEKVQKGKKGRFTPLLILAIPLSLGSLIWTTYSLLDFFQVGGINAEDFRLEDLSIVGLSAAATADIAWSATMVAEYREVRLTRARLGFGGNDRKQKNLLPYIGWAEVLLVTLMLALHGKNMGNGEAAFAAALPILTKLSWMMVISDLKDPSELTEEMKLAIAEKKQRSKMKHADMEATAEAHQAAMEEQRRRHAAELEEKRAAAEKLKLDQQTKHELEEMELRGANSMKLLKQQLTMELQVEMLKGRRDLEVSRADFEQEMSLRIDNIYPPRNIVGEVVRHSPRQALSSGNNLMDEDDETFSLAGHGLSQSELKQAQFALSYYTVNASREGGVTKAAFCKANQVHPPRLSEATANFPEEWFMERGLATWTSAQN